MEIKAGRQLAPRNVPAAPSAPVAVFAPAPVSAPLPTLTFAKASAFRGPVNGSGGWFSTPSRSASSGDSFVTRSSRRSVDPGDEQEDAFDSTDRRSRSEH